MVDAGKRDQIGPPTGRRACVERILIRHQLVGVPVDQQPGHVDSGGLFRHRANLRRIIGQTARNWVGRNLLPFLALGALVFGVALAVQETLEWRGHFAILVVCAVASLAYCLLGLRLLDPALRNGLWMLLKSVISLLRGVVELR